jgi:hypothetical protein
MNVSAAPISTYDRVETWRRVVEENDVLKIEVWCGGSRVKTKRCREFREEISESYCYLSDTSKAAEE